MIVRALVTIDAKRSGQNLAPATDSMATTTQRRLAKEHPKAITGVLSLVGYALVLGAFAGVIPLFPPLSEQTVILFSDLIAIVNSLALFAILIGWRFIRRGEVQKHRAAMLTAFALICVFLVLYLWKVGGGFEKSFVVENGQFLASIIKPIYLLMLAIHIGLSVLAVPVVLYAVVLGLTHTPTELAETAHARVGRIAVASWSISLALGIVTYLLLNHVYGWVPREEAILMFFAVPARQLWYSAKSDDRTDRH